MYYTIIIHHRRGAQRGAYQTRQQRGVALSSYDSNHVFPVSVSVATSGKCHVGYLTL